MLDAVCLHFTGLMHSGHYIMINLLCVLHTGSVPAEESMFMTSPVTEEPDGITIPDDQPPLPVGEPFTIDDLGLDFTSEQMEVCGDVTECLLDLLETGDHELAIATREIDHQVEEETLALSECNLPLICHSYSYQVKIYCLIKVLYYSTLYRGMKREE